MLMQDYPCWSACLDAQGPAVSFSYPWFAPLLTPLTGLDSTMLMQAHSCWPKFLDAQVRSFLYHARLLFEAILWQANMIRLLIKIG